MAPPAGSAAVAVPLQSQGTTDEQSLRTYFKTKIDEAQVCFHCLIDCLAMELYYFFITAKSSGKEPKCSSSSSTT